MQSEHAYSVGHRLGDQADQKTDLQEKDHFAHVGVNKQGRTIR